MSAASPSDGRAIELAGGGRLPIGGEWVASDGSHTFPSVDPSTGKSLADVPIASERDVARAVAAAVNAQVGWRRQPARSRGRLLMDVAAGLRRRGDALTRVEAIDSGMPIRVARSDLQRAIDALEYYAGLAEESKGTTYGEPRDGFLYSLRQPYGVIGVVTPFNHPLLFAVTKVVAALVTGNSIVLKPPQQAPLSTLLVAEAMLEVLPPGVFNVVTGDATTGRALVGHPDVGKVSFTGSVASGRAVMATAAANITPVLLELGGKNAAIILPDMDVARAADGVIAGMSLGVCGQSCQSATRLYIHDDLHDALVAVLVERLGRIRVGDPLDEATAMGPLISVEHRDRVEDYMKTARQEGAVLAAGGGRPQLAPELRDGYFVEPTVFTRVDPDMTIARDEIFGPVLSVFRWHDLDAVIDTVNRSRYGLTASVWTQRLDALTIAPRLDVGYVFVNRHGGSLRNVPFGGWKESGIGTVSGVEELDEYTRIKTIDMRLGGTA